MWWRNKLLLLPLLVLTGCGFEPLYGKNAAGSDPAVLGGVYIDPIPGRMGQQFRSELEDKLNPEGRVPPRPAYRLTTTLGVRAAPIGVAPDGTISRYNVYLDSGYTLFRNSDGALLVSSNVRHVGSYNNVTGAYFSTYISEADAIKRGIIELAELYRQRLPADIVRAPKATGGKKPLPQDVTPIAPKSVINSYESRLPAAPQSIILPHENRD